MNIVHLIDCMDFMRDKPDNCYDLAIVDPPYGINCGDQRRQKSRSKLAKTTDYHYSGWDKKPVDKRILSLIMRISKNQIIFGANHFISQMPYNASCWIVWHKENGKTDFADCELAWTTFNTAVKIFTFRWAGMLQGDMKNKEKRIHPTQKPIALYKWLLRNYAKPSQTIFDSHVGSGSIRIACHDMGFDFEGCEIDADYYKAQEKRYQIHAAQGDLFNSDEMQRLIF